MREKDVENYLVQQAKAIGALVRKVSWIGLNHCPDRLIMLPQVTVWVEVKAPGQEPRPGQRREHQRMREHGQIVYVVDSKESVDELIQVLGRHL